MSDEDETIRNDQSLMKQLKEASEKEGVLVKLDDISEDQEAGLQQWIAFGKALTEARADRQT